MVKTTGKAVDYAVPLSYTCNILLGAVCKTNPRWEGFFGNYIVDSPWYSGSLYGCLSYREG